MTAAPAHVSVVGGGRWARVYLDVLDGVLPPQASLSVHTSRGLDDMKRWAAGRPGRKIVVGEGAPTSRPGSVAIVANAAHDHDRMARQLAQAGIPALVEKPLTPSWPQTRALVDFAASHGTPLAPSQVFLFARYIQNFTARVRAAGGLHGLKVNWCDPAGESRHGEVKRFDAAVPVHVDVLPHVVTILEALAPGELVFSQAVSDRDGLATDLVLRAGGIPCQVRLERQGSERRRIVEAQTAAGTLQLDFSQEPGVIRQQGRAENADPEWADGPRPLSRMLQAFFAFAGGAADERFGTALALRAARLSDQVTAGLAARDDGQA